jgi:geranylgeranyl diphosphate synthase type I
MTLPRILERYRAQIKEGLLKSLKGESLLYAILRYGVGLEDERGKPAENTGKLLRPSLVLFTAEELGGEMDRALKGALALELIHNFSLIHDDIQDCDETRRGQPTVWKRYGVAQAINVGDLMQALAFTQALNVGEEALSALMEATVEMIEGQGFDLDSEGKPVGVDSYLKMIDRKTGALIRCAFRMGGLIAGVQNGVMKDLSQMGKELGRAFQIRDDLLGIWGEEEVTGKPQGSDIRRKKKSLPVAIALARATGEEQDLLGKVYAKEKIIAQDVKRVIAVMERLGVRSSAEGQIVDHLDRAGAWLARIPFSQSGKEEMKELIDYLALREK